MRSPLTTDHRSLITSSSSLHLWSYYGLRSQVWLYRLLSRLCRRPAHLLVRREWLTGRPVDEFSWPARRMHCFPDRALLARLAAKLGPYLRSGNHNALNSLDTRFVHDLVRRIGARVLHVHFGWLATDVLSGSPEFGAPVVVSLYGSDVFRAHGAYRRKLVRLLHQPHQFVVTSQALSRAVISMGAKPEHVHVIPVGIDAATLPAEKDLTAHRKRVAEISPLRLITVGRFISCKAPQELPQIARALVDKGLAFEWTMVGDGPLLPEFKKNAAELDVLDRFTLQGSMPASEVQRLLWDGDVMVHNAVVAPDGEREALGVVLIEAQALGIPVVSCRVGGIPEAVIDGQTGLLVGEGDGSAMADAIMRLATDPALRCEMALAGMHHVRDHFDSAKLAVQLESVYDAIQGNPGILPGIKKETPSSSFLAR